MARRPASPSSSPSTTRRPGSPRCSRACTRRSTRWASRYEIVFVNDGSRDRSAALLREQFERRPDVTRVSCSTATSASTWRSSPASSTAAASASSRSTPTCRTRPRKSRKLLAEMDAGHDYVGAIRRDARGRRAWRRWASRAMNRLRERITAHPHDRPGLHAARLQPRRSSTRSPRAARSARSSRRSPTRSRSNPTEIEVAHEERARRRVEVFALQADPPQLRPRHRLLAGAAAALLAVRHAGVACRLAASYFVVIVERAGPRPEWRGALEALWDRDILAFFLIGMLLFGLGLRRRVRRPHLPAGARAAALPRAGGAGAHAMTRAADARDSRRRLRLPRRRRALPARCCCDTASTCRSSSRTTTIRTRTIWFDSVARTGGRARGLRGRHARRSERPGLRRARRGARARFPVLVLLPADAVAGAAGHCRRAARSTCTARCCRSIAAARR